MRKHSYEVLASFPFTGEDAKRGGACESVQHTVTDEETGQSRVYIETRIRVGDRFICLPHDADTKTIVASLSQAKDSSKGHYRALIEKLNNESSPSIDPKPLRSKGRRDNWRGQ